MKKVVFIIFLVVLNFNFSASAQEVADFNDIYVENDLLYKVSNDSLFTGICERRRKNGHLVVQETVDKGVILTAKHYYNGKAKRISDSIVYNPQTPYKLKTIYRFNLESKLKEKETYDDYGKLKLKEEFENKKLVYSCQYNGKKKHGKEFCYSKDGKPLEFEYINGKKVKKKPN